MLEYVGVVNEPYVDGKVFITGVIVAAVSEFPYASLICIVTVDVADVLIISVPGESVIVEVVALGVDGVIVRLKRFEVLSPFESVTVS